MQDTVSENLVDGISSPTGQLAILLSKKVLQSIKLSNTKRNTPLHLKKLASIKNTSFFTIPLLNQGKISQNILGLMV